MTSTIGPRASGNGKPSQPIAAGNFGDCQSLGQGLYELQIDWWIGGVLVVFEMP